MSVSNWLAKVGRLLSTGGLSVVLPVDEYEYVATDLDYCSTHLSADCDHTHAHTDCHFHQLFYEKMKAVVR